MNTKQSTIYLKQIQQWGLIILRIILGWYFLYEGIIKLIGSGWSAESYLNGTSSFLSGLFHWMASNSAVMEAVDFLNIWGLILIGLGLFLGFFARTAVYAGILLLSFYYIAYPPLQGYNFGIPQEGHYLLVDKNFIILVTLVVLALFPRTLNIGLLSLLKRIKFQFRFPLFKITGQKPASSGNGQNFQIRREILKQLAFLPFLGSFLLAFGSDKKHARLTDVNTGGTITLDKTPINELEGEIPQGKLGNKSVSRLILGHNLMAGYSHARDLLYARSLFKAYNTERKVFETLLLAERAGVNTTLWHTRDLPIIDQYKKLFGSNLQTMVQVRFRENNVYEMIDRAIDQGADFIEIEGGICDMLAYSDKIDLLQKAIDRANKQGVPIGIGAHDIHTYYACDKAGIEGFDFYFKTLHSDNYWSAIPEKDRIPFGVTKREFNKESAPAAYHDNMWCVYPQKTIDYIQKAKKPVVAFKVLAAGAIHPEEGFQYAFDNGADFIGVGMFDFQIVEDANHVIRSIKKSKNSRKRPWYG